MEINIALSPLWNIAYGYARIYQNVTVLLHSNITDFSHACIYSLCTKSILIFYSIRYFNGLINYTRSVNQMQII